MAFLCFGKDTAQKFRDALEKDKGLIKRIVEAPDTATRENILSFLGEDASKAATLFEEKLILKNKVQGLKNAIAKIGELGRYDPAKKAQLEKAVSDYRSAQQERVFNPKQEQTFLGSVAEKILGTEITKEQAKTAWDLRTTADKIKETDYKNETWSSPEARGKYGAAEVIYKKFVDGLKNGDYTLKETLKGYIDEKKFQFKENAPKAVASTIGDAITGLFNIFTNLVATLDNSFLGRQGAITLTKNPKIWWNIVTGSFSDIIRTFGDGKAVDALWTDIFSRPNYVEGRYEKAKLFPRAEEETPSGGLLGDIPYLGKPIKAADIAFNGSAIRARADLFDMLYNTRKAAGMELNDTVIKDIGTHVNAITARGKMGQIGNSKIVSLLLWAPKMLKADWDILTGHTFGVGLETKTMRVEALKTIVGVAVATAATAAIADAIDPGSVEFDPRSANFMAIKKGKTTIKIPFPRGMTQLVILMSRLITKQSKSSQTGIITELNSGKFGAPTMYDVGLQFLANKTQPAVNSIIQVLQGRTYSGQEPSVANILGGLQPISVQNVEQLRQTADMWAALGVALDFIGVNAQTYTYTDDWNQGITKELQAFKDKVGEKTFSQANNDFNKQYGDWLSKETQTEKYKSLSNEDKQKLLTKQKAQIKAKILKQYGA